jgi:glycosyltransferase involved in cell wall biosynthesis
VFSVHIDTARTWRGGQNQVLLTVLALRAMGHRTVLVAHPAGELRRRAAEGLDVLPIAPKNEVDLRAAWHLARALRQLRPDVVHAHDPHGVAMAAQALAFARHDIRPPLVASRRVDFHIRGNTFSRWKYNQVNCFICASEAIRRMVVDDGIPEEKTTTVHEGVDVERVRAMPVVDVHREFWLPHDAPVVGNIAALVPHKGHAHLIDAAVRVRRDVPDARFLILGEGELRPVLERHIKEQALEKHVFLTGFRPDALSLLKTFDVFVLSSVTEGLGTSLLDAMACGKAIVATKAGGIPEVVQHGETGFLVPPRDDDALARAIVKLLRDPSLRARMGAAGLDRVRARFTVDRMARATLDVYERVGGKTLAAGTPRPSAAD